MQIIFKKCPFKNLWKEKILLNTKLKKDLKKGKRDKKKYIR